MKEILSAVLRICFAPEVWISVLVSLGLLLLAAVILVLAGRLYRMRFVRMVRRLTGIEDAAHPRRVLERSLNGGWVDAGVVAKCEGDVATGIAHIYELSGPCLGSRLVWARNKAVARLNRAIFPELILPKGERTAFFQRCGPGRLNGGLIFELILQRELNRIYSVDVALRAIRAAERPVGSDSKRRIDICRLRVGSSKNLARLVLRHILRNSADVEIKPVAEAELTAMR
jgi:hypothetical protein